MSASAISKREKHAIDQSITDSWLSQVANSQYAADYSNKEISQGKGLSQSDLLNMQFQINQQNAQNQWSEEMYNKYQSPQAIVDQYQKAGLNSALMYGSGASGGQISGGASNPAGGTTGRAALQTEGIQIAQQVISLLTGVGSVGSQIGDTVSSIKLRGSQQNEADARASLYRTQEENTAWDTINKRLDAEYKKVNNFYAKARNEAELAKLWSEAGLNKAKLSEIASHISLNNSIIEMNGQRIELMKIEGDQKQSEIVLNQAKTTLANLDAAKASAMLPYVEAMQKADLALKEAQGTAAQADAEKRYADAAGVLLDNAKKQGLLDAGIVDQEIKKMKNERWTNSVNCIVGNTCNVVNTTVGALTGTSALISAMTPRNPIGFSK